MQRVRTRRAAIGMLSVAGLAALALALAAAPAFGEICLNPATLAECLQRGGPTGTDPSRAELPTHPGVPVGTPRASGDETPEYPVNPPMSKDAVPRRPLTGYDALDPWLKR